MRAILTYHSIDPSGSPISVSPAAFRRHVAWLDQGPVRVVSLNELVALPDSAHAVALTFDDGLASLATDAAPVLADHGLPATVFVVTQRVGGDNRWRAAPPGAVPRFPLLDWGGLGRLVERGMTMGSHTRSHPRLTRCGDAELADELAGAAEDIRRELGLRAGVLAYPYGDVDRRVVAAARPVYDLACTTALRCLRGSDPPLGLPRLDAYYLRDGDRLTHWGTARFRRYLGARRAARALRRRFA